MNNNYQDPYSYQQSFDIDTKVSMVMKRVYLKMTLALIVTALTAYFAATTPAIYGFFLSSGWTMWLPAIVGLLIVFGVSGGINRISSSTATLLFFLFSICMGLMVFPVMLVYTPDSLYKTFFITAGVFGAMSVYGYFTSQDLTKWGSILIMCLFGLIIVSLVNIFLKSTTLEWIISGAGVLIFIGLTAWDTQQIKRLAQMSPMETVGKLATIGALNLYLDFINLFLYLLRFFGNSRD
ncbi:MAG: Bax inhibitor-1/YccA family protein [Bacteroides sp.]|nr:Bax inhibitor-1/YccA family protein [Bacteroides sp.]MCM1413761.1 Bax inhibitor-1/YccA family protein [Bacteroides sp.]MCM1472220.1 Bax inhibitor-1/YccA family protein [Bacteroides sp.]